MKITFNINYSTKWGESLYICGNIPALGNGDDSKALQMELVGPSQWKIQINVPATTKDFDYRYIVKPEYGEWRLEWGDPHRMRLGKGIKDYKVYDCWQDMPYDKPYYSSAFVDGILHRPFSDVEQTPKKGELTFRVWAPMIQPDEILAVAGNIPALGNWDVAQVLRLNDADYPLWSGSIKLDLVTTPFEYKFLILKRDSLDVVGWEIINNRICGIDVTEDPEANISIQGLRFANPNNHWRGAGTAIPVFSLRSDEDFGVGDFIDLKKMIDWCKMTGQKMLQILPINDTTMTHTWVDSYPYKANSTFALHPMFLRLEEVGAIKDPERRKYYENIRRELNMLDTVDYERVNNAKNEYLAEIYAADKAKTQRSKDYKQFVKANGYWLYPYAAWCLLRDKFGTPDNNAWGEYAQYDADRIEKFISENENEIGYYCFVQYHLDKQLRTVRDYAHSNGVVLKGDIPIGISRFSVDAWLYPELFNMDVCAGAPPDDFSILGQNWGFPTYNWEMMARDGFEWWKSRFRKMSEYFDAYRIDHILGFFRIWQIPTNALHGLLGYFNPALPFAPEELRHNYDFWINPDVHTRPLILEWMLSDFFGEHVDEVKDRFLDFIGDGRYRLKDYVDTQIKVAEYFETQEKNAKNEMLCNALLGLIDDVLFIEDPYEKGKYHPRISAQFTYQYRCLNDYEKSCFDRLYTDFFYRRHNEFWGGKAMWKLPPLLDSTKMLTCAEDLGMIPDCVPSVMDALEILSLEIQRMPKDPKASFGDTWHYPYFSVCTTSTHDMPGIRAWWESDREMTQKYFNEVLHQSGNAPYFAEPWVCEKILDLHLKSPSMLCVIPLQDWLSADGELRREKPDDEQINVPANPKHYWRYRMHLTLEGLMAQTNFNNRLSEAIKNSGR